MATLRAAYQRFVVAHDQRGALLCAAALVLTGQLLSNFRDFTELLPRLQPMKELPPPVQSADEELLGLSALLVGQVFFDLADPEVDRCALRIVALLQRDLDINLRLAAARMLLYYIDPRELRELAQRVNALVQPELGHDALTPHRHGHWLVTWRGCLNYAKEAQQEGDTAQAALKLAQQHDLRDIQFLLAFDAVGQCLPSGDLAGAELALAQAEALVDPTRLRELMLLDTSRARLALMKGQADQALFRTARARKYAVELQCPGPMLAAYIVNEAQARLVAQDCAGARQQMEQALPLVPEGFANEIREMIDLIGAYEAIVADDDGARPLLAAVWARMRERQFYDTFSGYPEFGARLCLLALEHGVEVDFVASVIRLCKLAAPGGAGALWPWPLRIHALGRFVLQRDGVALTVEGKAQKKPLELLRALVAHGATQAGNGADVRELIELLWPDLEANAPKASFDMTLMRLRKLLQVEGALRLSDGRLWLEPSLVWCDVSAFEQDCDALHALLRGAGPDAALRSSVDHDAALRSVSQRLLRGHAGELFGTRTGEAWSVAPRARLKLRFLRAISDYCAYLEARAAWQEAIAVYEQGVAQDMLVEAFYRGLMRCHLQLGQASAALRVFQRCIHLLASELKVRPAAETLALYERIPQH